MKLIIEDDEGRKTVVPFVREEITIGRQEGNTIRLTERNVSRRHARLVRQNGHVLVEDLGSYNGIRINGEKIHGQTPVRDGDLIQIGDYDLAIQSEAMVQAAPQPAAPPPLPAAPTAPLGAEEAAPTIAAEPPSMPEPETDSSTPLAKPLEQSPGTNGQHAPPPRQSTSIIRLDELKTERPRKLVDLDSEQAPRLIVLNTQLAGREFACIRTELRVGRTEDNDIAIDHRSLSRAHAKVVREDTGEWRIIDLQSANGLSVNGERYAQATLHGGDVVELGHVKLKFLAPGESFRFRPGRYDGRSAGPARAMIGLGVGLVALIAGLFLAWRMSPGFRQLVGGGTPEKSATGLTAEPHNENPEAVAPSPTPDRTAENTNPPPDAPAVQVADKDSKLKGARAAMDAREFDRAVDILESIQNIDGSHPGDVEDLLTQARSELTAKKALTLAQRELSAGRFEQAETLLGQAQGTLAYLKEYEQLRAKLDAAAGKKPREVKGTAPATAANAPNAAEEAKRLYDEGYSLVKKKQFKEAQGFLTKCIKVDKTFARCHMLLGSTYAKLREPELGAKHYRLFVELAPDDPDAARVKALLDQYDRSRRE